ncbi:hypothetical protein PG991_014113 [Apiospora marii]|uniref:Hikeshi-like domain-containing protein n=1 Tax=Apiospora marii TaxID=335849 RepID=A0ABR1R8T8_9PEZI
MTIKTNDPPVAVPFLAAVPFPFLVAVPFSPSSTTREKLRAIRNDAKLYALPPVQAPLTINFHAPMAPSTHAAGLVAPWIPGCPLPMEWTLTILTQEGSTVIYSQLYNYLHTSIYFEPHMLTAGYSTPWPFIPSHPGSSGTPLGKSRSWPTRRIQSSMVTLLGLTLLPTIPLKPVADKDYPAADHNSDEGHDEGQGEEEVRLSIEQLGRYFGRSDRRTLFQQPVTPRDFPGGVDPPARQQTKAPVQFNINFWPAILLHLTLGHRSHLRHACNHENTVELLSDQSSPRLNGQTTAK